MLNHHPNIAIPYETHFIPKYLDTEERYGDLSLLSNREILIKDILDEEMIAKWDEIPSVDAVERLTEKHDVAGIMDGLFRAYAEMTGKTRWGDKSAYLSKMHVLANVYPEARFIHIVRDGRDVASSFLRLTWDNSDIIELAEWWRDHVRPAGMVGAVLGPARYHVVRYEDLVSEPEVVLTGICKFLGESFSPDMLAYHENTKDQIPLERQQLHHNTDKPPETSRVYAWKHEMKSSDMYVFTDYARDQLMHYGYEVPECSWSGRRLGLAKLTILLKRAVTRVFHEKYSQRVARENRKKPDQSTQ